MTDLLKTKTDVIQPALLPTLPPAPCHPHLGVHLRFKLKSRHISNISTILHPHLGVHLGANTQIKTYPQQDHNEGGHN